MFLEKSNAQRFLTAYNAIDYALRGRYNLKLGMSFSEVVRKSVPLDSVVRKYEDKLIDYGRLRNAIVHRSSDEYVIAEPHEDVVEDFERLASLISMPPKIMDAFNQKPVTSVQGDLSIKDVIQIITQTGFSNIPVYKNAEIIGVANGGKLTTIIGKAIIKGLNVEDYISSTKIEEVIKPTDADSPYYVIAEKSITIEQALNLFFENRKLLVIIITKSGEFNEMPIGIITAADIMDMNKILDNY